MPLLLFFTLFALLDFVILFSVGSEIGLLTTLLLVLATGFIGLHLVRREGVATLARAQRRFAEGELPSDELLTGAALIFGGALLMAPGFLSDALGMLCLLPNSRRLLGRLLSRINLRFKAFQYREYRQSSEASSDWEQASSRRDHSQDTESHASPEGGEPLEGDFISKDEPRP